MRAGLRRRHRAAGVAPERVLEEHRLDVELVGLELVEDPLRVVGAVVVPDARVVAADDEVRAAEVLAADRVPDRLARAGVAQRGGERGDDDAVGRVVVLDQDAVALDAGRGRHVVGLRLADERVDEQAVDGLERALRQVLVRAVDRVTGLEADDAAPASFLERLARVRGIQGELGEGRRGAVEDGHLAGDVQPMLRVEARDSGMGLVRRAEAALGFALLVVFEHLLDLEDSQRRPFAVGEGDAVSFGRRFDGQAHRKRPGEPVREVHVLHDALVVVTAHEALERRQRAGGEQVQVGHLTRREPEGLEPAEIVRTRSRTIDESAAVRLDQARLGGDRHAATSTGTSPSFSSSATTSAALSSGLCASVSRTSSGPAGSSYGSFTPVNSLISPLNAFSYRPFTSRFAHSSTEALTYTSTNVPTSSTISRAARRVASYGEIAAAITAPPWRLSLEPTHPTRSMCVSRSSFERPSSFERCVRTLSPSKYSTTSPRRSSSGPTRWAIVDLPDPDSPVNQSVNPPGRRRSVSGCSWA